MELDELKNAWMVLDGQLKKNEILSKRLVQGKLHDKSNKSLSKLLNSEMFSIITLLLAIPLCIWLCGLSRFANTLFPRIVFVVVIVVSVFGIIGSWYILKYYLMKIDFSKTVKDNMYYVNKYIVVLKKGKILSYYIVIPAFSLLGILSYFELKAPFYLWVFLLTALAIGIVVTYWIYKKIYDANIQSIQKSLEELKELEEEAESN
jgi:glucan phosphoethanolaminetransferase (alkaline phosphatase superfamily)